MAWTSPQTWTAGTVLTASLLNTYLRDELKALLPLDIVAFTSWTPTLTQSGTVTKTVTYAKYQQFGKLTAFVMKLAITGAGTGNNKATFTLPVTAASVATVPIGNGLIFDTSASQIYPGMTEMESTTTAALLDSTQVTSSATPVLGLTGSAFAAAFASGDGMYACGLYEAA